MRLVLVAFGRRVLDLELLAPPPSAENASPVKPSYDPTSTTASHVEPADDGVGGFGFGLVIRAEDKP